MKFESRARCLRAETLRCVGSARVKRSLRSTAAISSQHPRGHARLARHPRMSPVSGCAVRLSCRPPNSTSPTRTTCCGHVSDTPDRLDMLRRSESRYLHSILVRHARFARHMFATSSSHVLRGCHEQTDPVEFRQYRLSSYGV